MPNLDGLRVQISRVLEVAPRILWRFLSEPGRLARWWGPAGFTSPSIELDVRVGGRYRIEMKPPDGDAFFLQGEFRTVDPPALLAYTFRWEEPDPDDRENVVTLSLTNLGDRTELALDHGPFVTEARRALHWHGWSDSFEKLARIVSATRTGP
jgi:uncharacterized protein YndB with AHSA1/START domain